MKAAAVNSSRSFSGGMISLSPFFWQKKAHR
jgi:hypothetical protein